MESLYLLDATVTETNAVKLKFLDEKGKLREVVDNKYKPYFFIPYPPKKEDLEVIRYLSGNLQLVEKIELFTGVKKVFGKVFWLNPKIALKAAKKLQQVWESEIEFSKSYIYDTGLVFGALHSKTSLKPVLKVSLEKKEKLEKTFKEIKLKDPHKYFQISYWFTLLNQPFPRFNPEILGVKEVDEEKLLSACMLSRVANLPLIETLSSRRVSDWIKSIIYTYLRKNNILIPTPEEFRRKKPTHKILGALTVSPKPGVYFNTVVCDFESLYPSCIDSFNLSYETVDCPHIECKSNKIPDVEYHVCTKRRGFYSILFGALKELRIRLFKPASKDNSLSEKERKIAGTVSKLLKLILVSSYGVTVRIHGVACPPLAEAITGYSRYSLKETWKMAEERGLKPLYGDTDSIFLDDPSEEQVEWLIKTVKERLNLDLAMEKRYTLCVLPKAKKAYFGILPDGTPDIRGVTPTKSNAPRFINNVFQECVKVLSTVKGLEDFEKAKSVIQEIVRKAIKNLKERHVKLEDLVYTVRLYFDPNEKVANMKTAAQQYQCALQLIDSGKKLRRWDTVSFVKVKPFNYKGKTFTVKPVEFVRNLYEINVEDYVRNLITALNQTFQPMGIKVKTHKEIEILKWLTGT